MYRRTKKLRYRKLKEKFGKNPLKGNDVNWIRNRIDKIQIYHKEVSEQLKGSVIDDITWNDLEMDEVFLRINHTKCFMGEQVLYYKLHDVDSYRDWNLLEEQIEYFSKNENERIKIEERLSCIGKKEEDYHLPTFLMHSELWKIESGFWLHVLQVLLVIFLVGSIFWESAFFQAGLIIVAMINLMIYLSVKRQYEVYLFSLGSLKEILTFSRWMAGDEDRKKRFVSAEVEMATEELGKLSKMMISWQGRKYASMTGDLLYMLNDYLMGITLLDVAAFNRIMKVIHEKQDKVLLLYEFAGNLDMMISVASFRESMDTWCQPNIWDRHEIVGIKIAHPLLEQPVPNDFSLQNRAIITGANASGKSTFMKAVAMNAILGQTIHTCTAESFHMPKLHIMTSMSLRDDILSGESYYIRETRYLKRMLDQVVKCVPTLCVIDEILKGTNTKERLAASSAILEYLTNTNGFVLIATHDIELVHGVKGKYEQYYFESQITENDIHFDYCIHKGISESSNAIALLSLLNFPQEILAIAKNKLSRSNL